MRSLALFVNQLNPQFDRCSRNSDLDWHDRARWDGNGRRRYPHRRAQPRWPSLRGGLLRVFAEAQKVMFAMDASGQPHILLQTVAELAGIVGSSFCAVSLVLIPGCAL